MNDPLRRARVGLAGFFVVLTAGTVAYRSLGLTWIDAFYQTLITVSTVGFSEVGTEITPAYRLVTSVVILLGVGMSLYTITLWFEGLMEGHFAGEWERRRMKRTIDAMSGHVVVCGWGQVGRSIGRSLAANGGGVVVIDNRGVGETDERFKDIVFMAGNATEDEVLQAAGIERARALVVALDTDADAMYVIVTARGLNKDLFIVSRTNSAVAGSKLRRAGADRVVNPHEIGGTRMAAFVLSPTVADFLGETMHDYELEWRLDELLVERGSRLDGGSIDAVRQLKGCGLNVLAVHHRTGHWTHRIDDAIRIEAGDIVVALGTLESHAEAAAWARSR